MPEPESEGEAKWKEAGKPVETTPIEADFPER